MAHIVSRRGYLSLEESYRDPVTGKPRKRYLRYLGKRASDPQARYEQMIATAERKGQEIDDAQRAKYGESNAERRERLEDEARFAPKAFLETTATTPDDTRDEPQAADEQAQEKTADEPGPDDTSESEA